MSIVYQHPTPSSISNDNKITNINNTNINKKVKGPTILGMGSRSAFPPTMPNQVLCKQNQRAHMEWQRQQWMEERKQCLLKNNNKKETSKEKYTNNNNNNNNEEEEKSEEMEKEVDDLLDWIGGIEMEDMYKIKK